MAEPSWDTSAATMLTLARRARSSLLEDGFDGVVISHGPDTVEGTAFLVDLMAGPAASRGGIILTTATRSLDELSAEGPRNLASSLTAAVDPALLGAGAVVCVDDCLHAARWVTHTDATSVAGFSSAPYPQLGRVLRGRVEPISPPPVRPPPSGRGAGIGRCPDQDLPGHRARPAHRSRGRRRPRHRAGRNRSGQRPCRPLHGDRRADGMGRARSRRVALPHQHGTAGGHAPGDRPGHQDGSDRRPRAAPGQGTHRAHGRRWHRRRSAGGPCLIRPTVNGYSPVATVRLRPSWPASKDDQCSAPSSSGSRSSRKQPSAGGDERTDRIDQLVHARRVTAHRPQRPGRWPDAGRHPPSRCRQTHGPGRTRCHPAVAGAGRAPGAQPAPFRSRSRAEGHLDVASAPDCAAAPMRGLTRVSAGGRMFMQALSCPTPRDAEVARRPTISTEVTRSSPA